MAKFAMIRGLFTNLRRIHNVLGLNVSFWQIIFPSSSFHAQDGQPSHPPPQYPAQNNNNIGFSHLDLLDQLLVG